MTNPLERTGETMGMRMGNPAKCVEAMVRRETIFTAYRPFLDAHRVSSGQRVIWLGVAHSSPFWMGADGRFPTGHQAPIASLP